MSDQTSSENDMEPSKEEPLVRLNIREQERLKSMSEELNRTKRAMSQALEPYNKMLESQQPLMRIAEEADRHKKLMDEALGPGAKLQEEIEKLGIGMQGTMADLDRLEGLWKENTFSTPRMSVPDINIPKNPILLTNDLLIDLGNGQKDGFSALAAHQRDQAAATVKLSDIVAENATSSEKITKNHFWITVGLTLAVLFISAVPVVGAFFERNDAADLEQRSLEVEAMRDLSVSQGELAEAVSALIVRMEALEAEASTSEGPARPLDEQGSSEPE